MKKIMQITSFTSLIFFVLGAQQVLADTNGFYLGADVGNTTFSGDDAVPDSIFVPGQKFSASDTSYGVHLGFQFTDWFAAELSYTDFGAATDRFKLRGDIVFIVQPNDTQTLSAKGVSLSGVFSYQLNSNFSLLGVLGITALDYENTFSGGFSPVSGNLQTKSSFSDHGLLYGVGAKYALTDSFSLRADLRHNDVGDFALDMASVGIEYSF